MNFQLQCRRRGRRQDEAVRRRKRVDGHVEGRYSKGERTVEDLFVRSLVAAGTSRECTRTRLHIQEQRRGIASTTRRNAFGVAVAYEPDEHLTREDYKELVNTYDSPSDLWEQPSPPRNQRKPTPLPLPPPVAQPAEQHSVQAQAQPKHQPLAPRLVLTPEQEERHSGSSRVVLEPESEEHAVALRRFKELVMGSDPGENTERIYADYERLPSPRVRFLDNYTVSKVFTHLAWVEFKTQKANERYFKFLDEALAADWSVTTDQWNTAIAFAGRWARYTSSEEVKRAVETWMRMENDGKRPSDVTFNILFDVAARAGRFALANIVVNELHARGLPLNRYYYTSKIFLAGLRRDGEGVRQAFRELVNAGEIVDTAVMNCVILGLVRAGEAASAENVFEKMKALHAAKNEPALVRTWRQRRKLGHELRDAASELRDEKAVHEASFFGSQYSNQDHKEAVQKRAPIHPDFRTCRILIRYHCYVSGNLERVREMLEELQGESCAGKIHGSIYILLFGGFAKWGGHAFTAWNRSSLEAYWADLTLALMEGKRHPSQAPTEEEAASDSRVVSPPYSPFHTDPEQGREAHAPPTIHDVLDLDHEADFSGKNVNDLPLEPSFEDQPAHFSVSMVYKAMQAFYRCAGARSATARWREVQEKWPDMQQWEREKLQTAVDSIVRDDYAGPRD